tara:strand:+ start:433 stop:657 length:225 start_codon:yes stop_codon:yes gene_type:complete
MTFGKWLKLKLKHCKVQQKVFAKQICVSPNTVTSWTTDYREPSIRNFIWICKFIAMEENTSELDVYNEASQYFT